MRLAAGVFNETRDADAGAPCVDAASAARRQLTDAVMNDLAIAIAIHVLAIVWWIGGVAMVTSVLLPAARRTGDAAAGLAMFQRIEERFAWHARVATLLAAASGFYMVDRIGLWSDFLVPSYWWLDAMVFVWAMFTMVLFVAEPLFVHRWIERQAAVAPARTLALIARLHWVALILSVVTLLGAAVGSHS
jgi:uncharacterized membrane protein